MSGFVETEELKWLLHLFVKVLMMKVSFNAQMGQTNKDGNWTNHSGGEPPDVTEGVGAVGGAAGKVGAGDVQGGESDNGDNVEDGGGDGDKDKSGGDGGGVDDGEDGGDGDDDAGDGETDLGRARMMLSRK